MNLFDVSGKKVIFTGATGGLGQSMAEGLLEAGAEVVLVGASGRCRTLAEEYRTRGWKAHGLPCDLASTEEIRDCFGKALDLLGGEIDVLVNAAGIQRRAPSEDFPLEDWQAVIDVNLTAPFLLSRLAGKQMIRQGRGGRIINIASMCSYFGGSTIPAYSASKGRHRPADQGHVQRLGKIRHHRQRHRPRLYGHAHERRPDGSPEPPVQGDQRPHSRRTLGHRRGHEGADHLSGLRRFGLY